MYHLKVVNGKDWYIFFKPKNLDFHNTLRLIFIKFKEWRFYSYVLQETILEYHSNMKAMRIIVGVDWACIWQFTNMPWNSTNLFILIIFFYLIITKSMHNDAKKTFF